MRTSGNTVLITGGATGIGLALAMELRKAGSEVIVCARTEQHLEEAKRALPGLHALVCDVSTGEGRHYLHDQVVSSFLDVNLLINNAGIQRVIDLRKGEEDILRHRAVDGEDEIQVNFAAYVYLAAAFIPDFLKREEAAIVNVSSGLGFVPMTFAPIYSATKAAIHSFSVSLRHQLRGTSIKVFELIPPTVNTDLDKGARAARGQKDRGIPPEEVATAAMEGLKKDEFEIMVGAAKNLVSGPKEVRDQIFARMNP